MDVKTIYEAPISFNKEKLDVRVLRFFKVKAKKKVNLQPWKKITHLVLNTKNKVNIAIIGKYVELKDAYKSLDEALTHGGIANNLKVNLVRIESDYLKPSEIKNKLNEVMDLSLKAHKIIGCKGVTRSDFKFYKNKFYLLEINTQPGMTKLSLVPEIAKYKGISFIKLIEWILKDAATKK